MSGALSHSASVTLVVNPAQPDFRLVVEPSSQTVTAGTNATYTATVAALNNFNGMVSFSISGLPGGASFTQFSAAAGTPTLSISTTSTIQPGSYPLTITAKSDTLVQTVPATLTINPAPPSFTLSPTAASSSRNVNAGASASYDVVVTPLNGFAGTVNFSVSGLPGVTLSPSSGTPGTIPILISVPPGTPLGAHTLTITGTSGSLTTTTTVTAVVTAP